MCVDRIKKSLDSVLLVYRHLNHVVQRLLIAQSEALSDVQHVNLSTGDHNADQCVVSCAQTLQTDGQTKGLTKNLENCTFTPLEFILTRLTQPSWICKGVWQRTWAYSRCTELWKINQTADFSENAGVSVQELIARCQSIPTASISLSKSPESSLLILSSMDFSAILWYSSNTEKQFLVCCYVIQN